MTMKTLSERKSSNSCTMSPNKGNIELDIEEALENDNTELPKSQILYNFNINNPLF